MPFRVSYIWKLLQDRTAGWSENFWNLAADLQTALQETKDLYPFLKALHGVQSVCTKARTARVDGPRESLPTRFTDAPQPPADTFDSDYVTNALLLENTGAPEGITRQWVGGIPDTQISKGGFMVLTKDYIPLANAFYAQLASKDNHWGLRIIDQFAGVFQHIEAVTDAGILTMPGHGIGQGDIVELQIKGVKSPTPLNGNRKVKGIDANTLALLPVPYLPGQPYSGAGFARLLQYTYPTVNSTKFIFATKHNRGRPIDVLSGKTKKKR
jgi:hypothetical protein